MSIHQMSLMTCSRYVQHSLADIPSERGGNSPYGALVDNWVYILAFYIMNAFRWDSDLAARLDGSFALSTYGGGLKRQDAPYARAAVERRCRPLLVSSIYFYDYWSCMVENVGRYWGMGRQTSSLWLLPTYN
jgi:hypothetical protein